jgi:hypothetical protein
LGSIAKSVGYLAVVGFILYLPIVSPLLFLRVSHTPRQRIIPANLHPSSDAAADGQNEPMMSEFARRPFWHFDLLSRWAVRLFLVPLLGPIGLRYGNLVSGVADPRQIEYVQYRRQREHDKEAKRRKKQKRKEERRARKQRGRTNGRV